MKRLIAAFACLPMLCPPAFASDWVEEGVVEFDSTVMQAPVSEAVDSPPTYISTPEVIEAPLNTDWADFAPGFIPTFTEDSETRVKPKSAAVVSLPMALADTEIAVQLQPLSEDVEPEFRMDRIEAKFFKPQKDGNVRERLNALRRELNLSPLLGPRKSFPDAFINAIGRGVTGGVVAGGKVAVGVPVALAKGTGQVLATPGVPELLLAGAILGVGIPLLVQAGKNNRGGRGSPDVVWVDGYLRADGTYVPGHFRTVANGTVWDNFSTKGNYNPYTGQWGTKQFPYYTP